MINTVKKFSTGIFCVFLLTAFSSSCKKPGTDDSALLLAGLVSSQSQDSGFYVTERMAIIDGAVSGTVADNEALALRIANLIASHIKLTLQVNYNYPFEWITAGQTEDTTVITDTTSVLLVRPPALHTDGITVIKGNVIEVCNSGYATAAMNTGKYHAPALPCKVQVWADHANNKIYVDMTDPRSIFKLFFTDVTDPSTLLDTKGNIVDPQTVYDEIQTLVKDALLASVPVSGLAALTNNITWVKTKIGPAVSSSDARGAEKPYIVERWLDSGADANTASDAAILIMDALGSTGADGSAIDLTAAKTAAEGWRNARVAVTKGTGTFASATNSYALSFPLGIKIIEPCSPKYAKTAMKYGMWHVGALPCKVAVYEDGGALYVSYLNPTFMFNVLFRDAKIDPADASLVDNVKADIKSIVSQGLTGKTVTVGGTLHATPVDVTSTVVK